MSRRPTKALQVFLICAAVFALIIGATGMAVAEDPAVDTTEATTPDTTADTTPTTTADTTPTTTADTTPTTTEDTTATTAPQEPNLTSLDVSTQAAGANQVEVTKAVQPGDPAGSFSIQLQRRQCTLVIFCSWVNVGAAQSVASGGTALWSDLNGGTRYRLVESVPTGWLFVSATCGGGSSATTNGVEFQHTSNAAWNCTFTNANKQVTIEKASDGPDAATIALQRCTSWVFVCLGWSNIDSSSYSDGTSNTFTSVSGGAADLYRVVETVPNGYRLTDVSCSGGATGENRNGLFGPVDGAWFALDAANPTRSCTFTNTQNRITVTKATEPGGVATSFEMNVEKCDVNIFANCLLGWYQVDGSPVSMTDGQTVEFTGGDLADPELFNRFFRVRESDPGSVWDVDVSCTGEFAGTQSGDLYEAFAFSLNQNVPATADCLVTNSTDAGSITVTKATDPADTHGNSFGFSFDGDDFSLETGQSEAFGPLVAGEYTIVETGLPDGWTLDGIDCGDASTTPVDDGVTVDLAVGQDVTCTFENTTELGSITVTKATDPADTHASEFDFSFVDLDDVNSPAPTTFSLTTGQSEEIDGLLPSSEDGYRILETDLPDGWTLDDVDCGDASTTPVEGGIEVFLTAGEDVECTFDNTTELGAITVAKVSDPAGGEDFDFEFADLDDPNLPPATSFTLDDDGSQTFAGLIASTLNGYEILETDLPEGWTFDGVDCGDATVNELANGVAVLLAAGQEVTCTFGNSNPTEPAISMTKTPDPASAIVGDTITYTYVVTNEGPVTVSDLTVVDTPLGPVDLDTTTLAPNGQPGDTATGTLTRAVTDADAGTTITNTALATGFVSCNPEVEVCIEERGRTEVTAEAETSVGVAAVGGEVVTNDPGAGTSSATTGNLPFTGSDPTIGIAAAVALLLAGGLLVLLDRRRRHGLGA